MKFLFASTLGDCILGETRDCILYKRSIKSKTIVIFDLFYPQSHRFLKLEYFSNSSIIHKLNKNQFEKQLIVNFSTLIHCFSRIKMGFSLNASVIGKCFQ
jgi:hypothetical protein